MKTFDPIRATKQIPFLSLRRRALDLLLTISIPFNRWLGLRIAELSPERVEVLSPDRRLRRNHVGGAHACALALMGEYAAGLLVAQQFPLSQYRMIIGGLNIEYVKQGRGSLKAVANAPEAWPELDRDGQAWVEMKTRISTSEDALVATCTTRWQVKEWSKVRSKVTA